MLPQAKRVPLRLSAGEFSQLIQLAEKTVAKGTLWSKFVKQRFCSIESFRIIVRFF